MGLEEEQIKTQIHNELLNLGFHNYYGDKYDQYHEFLNRLTKAKINNPDGPIQLLINSEYLRLLKDTNRPNINVYEDEIYY